MPDQPNPFCTRFVRPGAIEYRFQRPREGSAQGKGSSQRFVEALLAARFGLIVGPHGTGKSTLLQTLMPALRAQFNRVEAITLHAPGAVGPMASWRHQLAIANGALKSCWRVAPGGLLVVDGVEQLGIVGSRLLRIAAGRSRYLLGTSHQPVAGWRELWRTELTADMVQSLTEELLVAADPRVVSAVRDTLWRQRHRRVENLRDLWFDLYDVASESASAAETNAARESIIRCAAVPLPLE